MRMRRWVERWGGFKKGVFVSWFVLFIFIFIYLNLYSSLFIITTFLYLYVYSSLFIALHLSVIPSPPDGFRAFFLPFVVLRRR